MLEKWGCKKAVIVVYLTGIIKYVFSDTIGGKMKKVQRVVAMVAVIIEIGFIIWTCIEAFLAKPDGNGHFTAAIVASMLWPILIYVYLWTAKVLRGRGVAKEEKSVDNNAIDK